MSNNLSTLIAKLIQEFLARPAPDALELRQLVADEQVLPLFWDMSGVFTINPDGDILSFLWDDTLHPHVEYDPRIRNLALFQGSKRYSELKDYVPSRPDNARTCPDCGGTGTHPYAEKLNTDAIICYCGGLGWLPE